MFSQNVYTLVLNFPENLSNLVAIYLSVDFGSFVKFCDKAHYLQTFLRKQLLLSFVIGNILNSITYEQVTEISATWSEQVLEMSGLLGLVK